MTHEPPPPQATAAAVEAASDLAWSFDRPWSSGRVRLAATAVLFLSATVLALAVWLRPDPSGFGTHRQLGMGPCGILIRYKLPCPTCGMTTAFSNTVRGRLVAAIWGQPGGFALAAGTILAAAGSLYLLIVGRTPARWRRWLDWYYVFWFMLVAILGGWAVRLVLGLATGEFPYKPPG